jgi:hypothetical protein
LKQVLNKYKKITLITLEVLIGLLIVYAICLLWLDNLLLALVVQMALIFGFDFIFRKELVKSKRRMTWNIVLGILRNLSMLISLYVNPKIGLAMNIFGVITTRIMFFNDQDRTVQTVEELKEAYFIPTIIKIAKNLKERAIYVLND